MSPKKVKCTEHRLIAAGKLHLSRKSHGCDEDAIHTKGSEEGLQVAGQTERHRLCPLQQPPASVTHSQKHSCVFLQKQVILEPKEVLAFQSTTGEGCESQPLLHEIRTAGGAASNIPSASQVILRHDCHDCPRSDKISQWKPGSETSCLL